MGIAELLGMGGGQPQGADANMSAVVNPTPGAAAPATPEETASRTEGWKTLLSQLQTDPKMQGAALQFAAMVARPVAPGQNMMGHLTQALAGGHTYLSMLKQNEQRQAMAEREAAMREQTAAANIAAQEVQSQSTKQKMEAEAEMRPLEKQGKELQLKAGQAELQGTVFKNDPQRLKEMDALDKATKKAAAAGQWSVVATNAEKLRQMKEEEELLRTNPEARMATALGAGRDYWKNAEALKQYETRVDPNITDPKARKAAAIGLMAEVEARGDIVKGLNALNGAVNAGIISEEDGKAQAEQMLTRMKAGAPTVAPTIAPVPEGAEARTMTGKITPAKVATEADIQATMAATKLSRGEVISQIKKRGYTIQE